MPLRILGTSGQGFAAYAAAGAVIALIGCTGKVTREPVEHFRVVAPGRLSAGARVNEEGLRWLQERGIRTILNLERELLETVPGEVRKERARAQALGLSFIHFPLHPVTAPTLNQLDEAVRIIANTDDQVFVHCDHGIERTGMVVAAYRIKEQGWTVERAYRICWKAVFICTYIFGGSIASMNFRILLRPVESHRQGEHMNVTLRAMLAMAPAAMLFSGSVVLFFRERTAGSFLQLLGGGSLVVAVLTHISEAFRLFPWMGWGLEHSAGHYLDLCSAVLAVTLFPLGYLLHALRKRYR